MPAIVATAVLAHTALSADGKRQLFPQLTQIEIDDISATLDKHCEIDARSLTLSLAAYGGVQEDKDTVSHMKDEIFKTCREDAAMAALQYSAALNKAKRERL